MLLADLVTLLLRMKLLIFKHAFKMLVLLGEERLLEIVLFAAIFFKSVHIVSRLFTNLRNVDVKLARLNYTIF